MGTYAKYARHRSFSPKPPSEASFDAPRQKLAVARFGRVLRRGVAPFGDWLCQFAYPPNSKGFGCLFPNPLFFYSTAKLAKLVLLYFKTVKNFSRGTSLGLLRQKGGLTVASFIIPASRNCQFPPSCSTLSGFGYVRTVAFGEKLRWRAYRISERLRFEGIGAICVANRRKGALPPS